MLRGARGVHREGGDTGVHEARRRAWAEASYWLSGRSVAAAAASYSGEPEDEGAEAACGRGAVCAGAPRKNWAPSARDTPAGGTPGDTAPLLTAHRLGCWLQRKGGKQTRQNLIWGAGGVADQRHQGHPNPESPTAENQGVRRLPGRPLPGHTLRRVRRGPVAAEAGTREPTRGRAELLAQPARLCYRDRAGVVCSCSAVDIPRWRGPRGPRMSCSTCVACHRHRHPHGRDPRVESNALKRDPAKGGPRRPQPGACPALGPVTSSCTAQRKGPGSWTPKQIPVPPLTRCVPLDLDWDCL